MFRLLSTLFHQPINIYPKQLHLIVSSIISTFFSLLKHSFSLTLFNMESYGDTPAQSPNHRIKFSMCLCCCFRGLELAGSLSKRRLVGRSSAWLRSTARELPVIKEKCRNLMARMWKRHRNSVDFSYDPLSYALNFDDGENDEAQMMKSFSARLPALPPQGKCAVHPTVAMPGIVACGWKLGVVFRRCKCGLRIGKLSDVQSCNSNACKGNLMLILLALSEIIDFGIISHQLELKDSSAIEVEVGTSTNIIYRTSIF